MSKYMNMDSEDASYDSMGSRIEVSIFSVSKNDVTKEDVDTWMSQMVRNVYNAVRSASPNDRDIKIDIILNEKGNAEHLRH